jgi:hypothetical protein
MAPAVISRLAIANNRQIAGLRMVFTREARILVLINIGIEEKNTFFSLLFITNRAINNYHLFFDTIQIAGTPDRKSCSSLNQ